MATVQELERAFLNAHNAGDKQAAQALADALRQAMASQPAAEPAASKKEPETGFIAGMKSGYERLKGDIGAIGAAAGVEGAEEYAAKQREKAGEIYRQPGFTEAPVSYLTGLLGQSIPYMAAPVAAAAAAPEALGALGVAGLAGLASATQFTGSNISRQLEEGASAKDVNVLKAVAASVPQAALDVVSLRMIPGIQKIFGSVGRELTEKEAAVIAKDGILGTMTNAVKSYGPSVLKTAGVEGTTEAGQQFFERLQAGLSISDEDARREYLDNFVGGALLGGTLAIPGRAVEKAQARQRLAAQREEAPAEQVATLPPSKAVTEPAAPQAAPAAEVPPVAPPPTAPEAAAPEAPAAVPATEEDKLRARAEAAPEGEYVSGEPQPKPSEIENIEKERTDFQNQVDALKKGQPGESLWSAVKGKLVPSELAELGEPKRFNFLKAAKDERGYTISDLVADGTLDPWLPPEYRKGSVEGEMQMDPQAALDRDLAAEEYIKEIFRTTTKDNKENYLTYDTKQQIREIGSRLSDLEDAYREYMDEKTFNDLVQEAVDEQGRIYQDAEAALTEAEVGGLEPPARVFETIPEQRVEDEYYPDMSEVETPPPQTAQEIKEDKIDKEQQKSAGLSETIGELLRINQFQKALNTEPKYKRVEGGVSMSFEGEPNKQLSDSVSNNESDGVISALQNSGNPFIQRIGNLASQASPFGVGLYPDNAARSVKKYAGIYVPGERKIYMRSKAMAASEHAVAHEVVHHLTLDALRNPTAEQKPVVEKIEKLYKHVKLFLAKQGKGKLYGLKNTAEFVAEANSNVNFQYELSKIPYQKQNAWSAFTDFVSKLLGFKEPNALSDIISLTDELVSKPSQAAKYGKEEVIGLEKEEPSKVEKAKEAVKAALQPRKLPKSQFQHVPQEFYNKLEPIFAPEKKTIIDKIEGMRDQFWKKLAQGIADQYRSIKDIDYEAYIKARMSKTIDGALEGMLFNGEVKLTDGALDIAPNTKGLMQILEPVGNEVDSYQIWVALNREANIYEKSVRAYDKIDNLKGQIKDLGMQRRTAKTVKEANKISDEIEQKKKEVNALRSSVKGISIDPDIVKERNLLSSGTLNGKPRIEVYRAVQKEMNKLNRSVLNVALQQGTINKEAYEIYANDINYIPFYKVMEETGDVQAAATKSGLVNQYFSKALKGGQKPFGDLMENTLRNWSHILSASMKNEAANATLRAAVNMNGATPNLKAGLAWKVNEDGDGMVYMKRTGELVGKLKPEYTTSEGKGLVKTMIDGKTAYFNVTNPLLLESIMSIGYMGPKSKFLDVARDFKNMLQFGVTLSPAFKIRNLFRDSISAMAVSDLKKNPFANVIDGWTASDKNNPAHISALAGGAIFNFGSAYEGDQAKMIKRLLDKGVSGDSILDNEKKIERGLKAAYKAYQDWGNKSESANRMALYNQLKERGYSHLEASFYARDMLDFSMQGAWPAFRLVTQVVPFLNARVQGLYKLGRDGLIPTSRVIYNTATGKPIEATDKQKAEQFSIVMGAVALASLMLYMAFKDDDEFKKREQWDRDNFWWFKLPGMDSAIRVPKPFEIGAIGTMAERVVEQIVDQGAEGKVFEQSMKRMLTDTFAINPIPQMIKPLVDLYANKDSFTGAPIETAGMERLSKDQRIAEKTSPLAIALSKVTNVFLPESTEVSPVQADYAIKAYLGWLGGTISWSSHYAVQPFSKSAYPDNNWTETLSMGFIKSLPATQSKYVTAFYENNKEISQAYADMRHFAQLGEADKVQEILKEKGDKIAMAKFYDNASKDMAKVRQAILHIRADENMNGAQKKEEIDRLKIIIGEIAKQMEEARLEVKKQYAAAQ